MDYAEVLDYLHKLGNEVLTMRFSLDTIRALLAQLNNPQSIYPCVLIGGTNGKGSVASTLASILHDCHIKAGLYTSPHLRRIEERIAVDRETISSDDFARIGGHIIELVETLMRGHRLPYRPTYFETVTAVAFQYFAERKIDLAVLEVGLGGRLDATNVVNPICSAITSVSLDHQAYLGDTIEKIAYEKAGIIKPHSKVVSAVTNAEACAVIRDRCVQLESTLLEVDKVCCVSHVISSDGRYTFDLLTPKKKYEGIQLNLFGRHQIRNAATAILAAEILANYGFDIPESKIRSGIRNTRWRGRIDIISQPTRMILDGAHNIEAVAALKDFLEENVREKIILIFAAMRDKDIKGMAEIMFPLAEKIILTKLKSPRNQEPDNIATVCRGIRNDFLVAGSVEEALAIAKDGCDDDHVLVATGSFYLVGEVYDALKI